MRNGFDWLGASNLASQYDDRGRRIIQGAKDRVKGEIPSPHRFIIAQAERRGCCR